MLRVEKERELRLVFYFIQYGLNRLILHFQVNSCILSIAICSLCQANRTEQQEYV